MNFISAMIRDVKFDFYADDPKFKWGIDCQEDCEHLQYFASCFYETCIELGLELNMDKCCILSISKSRVVFSRFFQIL